jgi:hypothetical protein
VALATATPSPIGLPVAAAARSTTTVTVRLWSPKGGEFLAPGTISCEIDNGYVNAHQAYCQTITPAESVTMSLKGKLKKCVGQRCIGNPADNAEPAVRELDGRRALPLPVDETGRYLHNFR